MDFQSIGSRALAGDAHFFEDSTSPAKVRSYLESNKVRSAISMSDTYL